MNLAVGLGGSHLLGRKQMSGEEPVKISLLPYDVLNCRSSWATPKLAPSLSLGTRSLKKSLPFRSAWGMGCGEGEAEPGFLLALSRAQPAQGWVSLSFVPTHGPPQSHGEFILVPVPPAGLAQCCGTPIVWAGYARPCPAHVAGEPGPQVYLDVLLNSPLILHRGVLSAVFAHRCFLQLCDVHPLLPRCHAVAHPEGRALCLAL